MSGESHFYQLARFAIVSLVGEVPSVASALPDQRGVIEAIDSYRWEAYGGNGRDATRKALPANARL